MSRSPPRHHSLDTAEDRSRFVVISRRVHQHGMSPLRREEGLEETPPPRTRSSRHHRSRVPRLQIQHDLKSPTATQTLVPLNATARHLSGSGNSSSSPAAGGGGGTGSLGSPPIVPVREGNHAIHAHPPTSTPSSSGTALSTNPNTGSTGGNSPALTSVGGGNAFIPALSSRVLSTSNALVGDLNNLMNSSTSTVAAQSNLPTIFTVTSTTNNNTNSPATHSPKAASKKPNVRATLFERRNRLEFGSISLSMETFTEEVCTANSAPPSVNFRGWSKIPTKLLSAKTSPHPWMPPPLSHNLAGTTLKVVSYNILAQHLVNTDNYPLCPPAALTEEHRMPLIMDELRHAEADIVALSEVSVKAFAAENSLGAYLHSSLNYDGYHVANTSITGSIIVTSKPYSKRGMRSVATEDRDLDSLARDETDGVAIFFNNNRLELLEECPIYFNRLGMADTSLTPAERKNLLVKTHNVALVLVLRDLENPRWIYVVGTSHITWRRSESQLWQLHHVVKTMERLKMKYGGGKPPAPPPPLEEDHRFSRSTSENFLASVPPPEQELQVGCILAGDFNVEPHHPALEYLRSGALPSGAEVCNAWRDSGAVRSTPQLPEVGTPRGAEDRTRTHRSGSRQTSGFSGLTQPSPPPHPSGKSHRAPSSQGKAKNIFSTWPSAPNETAPPSPPEQLVGSRERRPAPETLRDLLGFDVNRRVVVSADTGEGESPLKMKATPEKPNTPPPPRRRDLERSALSCSPLKVWQRSDGSSAGDVDRLASTETGDRMDLQSALSDSEEPMSGMGLAEPHPLFLPPASTPRSSKNRHFSEFSGSSSDSPITELASPQPRRRARSPTPINTPTPTAPQDPPRNGRSFLRRTERPHSTYSFSPHISHQLRLKNPYESYVSRHPKRVTANSSGGGEGKVIDYILFDNELMRAVSVMRLGERSTNLPSWNCPSDHFMIGAVFRVPPAPIGWSSNGLVSQI